MRGLVALVVMTSCWRGNAPAPTPPVETKRASAPSGPLAVELVARPLQLTMAERDKFVIGFKVTNRSDAVIDPKLDVADLLINGEPSVMWANTHGNGGREPEWYELPPGQHVARDYTIGTTLFEKPGDYTLVLKVSDILSAPVQIHVRP